MVRVSCRYPPTGQCTKQPHQIHNNEIMFDDLGENNLGYIKCRLNTELPTALYIHIT